MLFAFSLFLFTAHSASAATYYVSTTGSDSNPGTSASPWRTIQKAANTMVAGDTVRIKAGTYQRFTISRGGTASAAITYKAYPGDELQVKITTADGTGQGIKVDHAPYITLDGLWVDNVNQGIYIYDSDYVIVQKSKVTNIGQECIRYKLSAYGKVLANAIDTCGLTGNGEGIYLGTDQLQGVDKDTHDILVQGNTTANTADEGIELKHGTYNVIVEKNTVRDSQIRDNGGININSAYSDMPNPNHVVRNNRISNITTSSTSSHGNAIRAATGVSIYNNLIYDSEHHGIRVPGSVKYPVKVYNNTFYNNGSGAIIVFSGSTVDIRNNIGPTTSGNIAASSGLFVNAGARDFHLAQGSAAINAGTTLAEVTNDYDGHSRPQGSAYDIGMDEYVSPPASFNYSLSNSGAITVTQGSSGSNTVTATPSSGTTQSVSYSASGLPSGATASFSPTSCNPTCSTTLTINTTASTPTGSYTITVTGSPLSKTTSFILTVPPPPPTDTTSPTVSLTVPANNATVSGTVTVSANASDNVGVAGVQFKLDGSNLGSEDTTSPYSISWNTASTTNGSHTLIAVARDQAGNRATSTGVSVTVSNTAPTPQSPYGGTPRTIPGTIQAEDYDNGGEGVAYHDTNTTNQGGVYRTDGVDIKNSSDTPSGPAIGWVEAGEWWEYTVNVPTAGTYTLEARVASAYTGKSFRVEIDSVDKTGPMAVPNTGPWDTGWATITKTGVSLTAGSHIMRIVADTDLFDINFVRFVSVSPPPTPLAHWKFNETSGTTASDSSGNDYSGTLVNGPTWTAGKYGNALNLDGSNDHVRVPGIPNAPTGDFTYMGWVRLDTNGDETFIMRSDGSGNNEFLLRVTSGKLHIQTNGTLRATTNTTIPTGSWTHLAATRSGSALKLYVNATLDANQGTDGSALSFGSCALFLGVDVDSGCQSQLGNGMDGRIDGVRIYSKALTQPEIQDAMNGA